MRESITHFRSVNLKQGLESGGDFSRDVSPETSPVDRCYASVPRGADAPWAAPSSTSRYGRDRAVCDFPNDKLIDQGNAASQKSLRADTSRRPFRAAIAELAPALLPTCKIHSRGRIRRYRRRELCRHGYLSRPAFPVGYARANIQFSTDD